MKPYIYTYISVHGVPLSSAAIALQQAHSYCSLLYPVVAAAYRNYCTFFIRKRGKYVTYSTSSDLAVRRYSTVSQGLTPATVLRRARLSWLSQHPVANG